jgi:hypothetical protein
MSDDHAPGDDVHIEIADIREPGDGAGSRPSAPPTRSTLWRLAARVAPFLALALIVGALLRISASVSPAPPAPPTATPAPVPLGPVILRSNVSYGRITLNGRQVSGSPPLVATFRTGANALTLSAPPFAPQSCRITWPGAQVQSGKCDTDRSGLTYTVNGQPVKSVLVVTINLTQDALPADLQASALAAVTQGISAIRLPTTVPAGQYIAMGRDGTGRILIQRAAGPLRAEVLFQLSTTDPSAPGGICSRYCGTWIDPEIAPMLVGQVWVIEVEIASLQWHFTASSGETVASAVYAVPTLINLALTFDGRGGWQVSLDATQVVNGFSLSAGLAANICDTGSRELEPLVPQGDYVVQMRYNDVEGCAIQLQAPNGINQGSFVWRFGVLLAADAQAHHLAPMLPVAPPAEIAAVSP